MPTLKDLRYASLRLGGLLSAALTLPLLYGCFNPNTPPGKFPCTTTADCPDSQVCSPAGLCVLPGSVPDLVSVPDLTGGTDQASTPQDMARQQEQDQSMGPADMSMMPPRDMVTQRDQATGPADLATVTGCSSGKGTQVGKGGHNVWACPGTFNSQAGQGMLCRAGYAVCTTGDNVDENTCNHAGRFFLLDYLVSYGTTSLLCGDGSGLIKDLLGCGSGVTYHSPKACQGLTGAIACQLPNYTLSGWGCMNSFQNATNSNAADGVLCCQM